MPFKEAYTGKSQPPHSPLLRTVAGFEVDLNPIGSRFNNINIGSTSFANVRSVQGKDSIQRF